MSQNESFGIVYLEAAASGLAQVVHRCETTEWILGDAAVYADTSDIPSVAAAVARAIAPGAAGEIGRRARERVLRGWTWDTQAAKYREFILATAREPEKSLAVSRRRELQHPALSCGSVWPRCGRMSRPPA